MSRIFLYTILGTMVAAPVFVNYTGGINTPSEKNFTFMAQEQNCSEAELDANRRCPNYRNSNTARRLGSRSYQSGK